MNKILIYIAALLFVLTYQTGNDAQREVKKNMNQLNAKTRIATVAGGCFWCVESDLEKLPGVLKVVSGYTGGTGANPTYETYGKMGHVEAVQVFYNP